MREELVTHLLTSLALMGSSVSGILRNRDLEVGEDPDPSLELIILL